MALVRDNRLLSHVTTVILLIAGVVTACFLWIAAQAGHMFVKYMDRVNVPISELHENVSVLEFYGILFSNEVAKTVRLILPKEAPPSDLPKFQISIARAHIDSLNSNLPESGRSRYYPAHVILGGETERTPTKLRYRGDNEFHWMFDKKSYRLKLKKGESYKGYRKLNLINPRMNHNVTECLSYELAEGLGLMAPLCEWVTVYLNGEYQGVFYLISQVDETLLRRHSRMPGSIYQGDWGPIDEDTGVSRLWMDMKYWDKIGARNAEQAAFTGDIETFLNLSNETDPVAFREGFLKYTDVNKWMRYAALDVALGSNHHDFQHNHKIYFDPYIGRMEPIEWDAFKWFETTEGSLNPITVQMHFHADLMEQFHRELYALLQKPEMGVLNMAERLELIRMRVRSSYETDPYRDTAFVHPIGRFVSYYFPMSDFDLAIDSLKAGYMNHRSKIMERFASPSIKMKVEEKATENQAAVKVRLYGQMPVELDFSNLVSMDGVRLYQDMNFNGILDDGDQLVDPGTPVKVHPAWSIFKAEGLGWMEKALHGTDRFVSIPEDYAFIVEGTEDIPLPAAVNSITGEVTRVDLIEGEMRDITEQGRRSIHPWQVKAPVKNQIVWSGEMSFENLTVISAADELIIEPGTRLVMGPDASILIRSAVEIRGTADEPVIVEPADVSKPWGSFIIRDDGANGARINHLQVSGGSVLEHDLVKYSGMFTIQNVQDFIVDGCRVGANHVGDDAMHVGYSTGIIENCILTGARSDALDVDISDVEIRNSVFIQAGNDSVDLMTSKAYVHDILFLSAGDKCISTGEASTGRFENLAMYDCGIGTQIKDGSVVDISDTVIANSRQVAVDLYNKNVRYDTGGQIGGSVTVFGTDAQVTADAKSDADMSVTSEEGARVGLTVLGRKLEAGPFPPLDAKSLEWGEGRP